MFALQNAEVGSLEMSGVEVESVPLDNETTLFDASLWMREGEESLEGALEYNTDLFDQPTIQRMVDHFRRLVEDAVAHPGKAIAELELLSSEERGQLLGEHGGAEPSGEGEGSLAARFRAQAERSPERAALVYPGETWTYAELDSRVEVLAQLLAEQGVGPESRVGVCLEREPWLVAAMLAVNRAGGAWVPLDPSYPAERLELVLEDAEVEALVSRAALVEQLPDSSVTLVEPPEAPGEPTPAPWPSQAPEQLTLVIYTSGSTGRPKGVALARRGVEALLDWALQTYSDGEMAGVLASTSISFDLSVFELFAPLVRGGTVLLAQDALDLPRVAAGGEVTLINTVPSAMTSLLDAEAVPSSVQVVNLAGEPLRRDLVHRIHRETKARRVFNLYGPSEDTTYSTGAEIPRDVEEEPTIGRSLRGGSALVLGPSLELVPSGAPGEICLAGLGLARGYLGHPSLTAQRFVPDPYGTFPGTRLYRTGDLARHAPDGELVFLGRRDHQVKLRGYRIELGELEAVLAAHGQVREAVARVLRNDSGDARLIAYLETEGQAPEAADLRIYLAERLPAHMVPSGFEFLEELPRTPNGKVDRRALPEPGTVDVSGERFYVPPSNDGEREIAALWEEILEVERVGIHDNFFELGGHSLLATRVVARLQRSHGIQLPLRTLFELPTVAQLAPQVAEEQKGREEHDKIAAALAMLEGLSEEEASQLLETTAAMDASGNDS